MMEIIKKIVGDNKKSWDRKINYALRADQITKKEENNQNPI
jgi:hypothetical protein